MRKYEFRYIQQKGKKWSFAFLSNISVRKLPLVASEFTHGEIIGVGRKTYKGE